MSAKNYTDKQEQLARFAKAMGHPARMAILEFLAGQDTSIMNSIQKTLSQYTIEEVRESSTKEEIQEIILQDMQAMFGGDYVIAVNFSKFQQE